MHMLAAILRAMRAMIVGFKIPFVFKVAPFFGPLCPLACVGDGAHGLVCARKTRALLGAVSLLNLVQAHFAVG